MKVYCNTFWLLFIVNTPVILVYASHCGCKTLRPCYKDMLEALQDADEEACIENASVGASTMTIFFKALKLYCGDIINIISERSTFEGRHLHEVTLYNSKEKVGFNEDVPVIVVDAGQEAGAEPTELALYLIEQLVACEDQNEMIQKVKWVILPCTNPDGFEYGRFERPLWRKNTKVSEDKMSYGVDISRNFDSQWDACDKVTNVFSSIYPGVTPVSESETMFIKNVLLNYKNNIKAYLSIRRNGHAVLYPYSHKPNMPQFKMRTVEIAANIAMKVNQRGAGIQVFINDSIYNANGKPRCGHSVDFAFDLGIPLAFEMRVYHTTDLNIISKFQSLPKGYGPSLRNSYFSGIRELYNAVVEGDKKIKKTSK